MYVIINATKKIHWRLRFRKEARNNNKVQYRLHIRIIWETWKLQLCLPQPPGNFDFTGLGVSIFKKKSS